jgi:hypothetical protein
LNIQGCVPLVFLNVFREKGHQSNRQIGPKKNSFGKTFFAIPQNSAEKPVLLNKNQ